MKAFVFTRYGPPDVLELRDIPTPTPKDDEVLVRVHAVSLNDWDWAMKGDPINRMMFGVFKPTRHPILGSDIAGVVEAVGRSVRRFKPGDEVFGDLSGTWGGFAESVCARENALAPKSPRMTFEQAAAIPQAAMLAVQALIDKARIRDGQKILINGAGGGVGTFGVQLAKMHDIEVTAVDSAIKLDMLRSIGADHVVDYQSEDFTKLGKRWDVIFDIKTMRSVPEMVRVLRPDGVYVSVGGSMARLFQGLLRHPRRLKFVALKVNKDLALMTELFEAGKVAPVIDGPYPLDRLREAFRHFETAQHLGKIVMTVP